MISWAIDVKKDGCFLVSTEICCLAVKRRLMLEWNADLIPASNSTVSTRLLFLLHFSSMLLVTHFTGKIAVYGNGCDFQNFLIANSPWCHEFRTAKILIRTRMVRKISRFEDSVNLKILKELNFIVETLLQTVLWKDSPWLGESRTPFIFVWIRRSCEKSLYKVIFTTTIHNSTKVYILYWKNSSSPDVEQNSLRQPHNQERLTYCWSFFCGTFNFEPNRRT
jgi:hypothetical protein